MIESRTQAICLLPDDARVLPAMLDQAAAPLCEKFSLTRRAVPPPPPIHFEEELEREYGSTPSI